MNFWTSILAVIIANALLSALKYTATEALIIIALTSIIYLFVNAIIDKWNTVG
jgi:hypothetical protein